jgi:hypothetical protein
MGWFRGIVTLDLYNAGGGIVGSPVWRIGFKAALLTIAILSAPSVLSAQGPDTLWAKSYGGAGIDAGYAVQETADSGFVIVGETESFGGGDLDVFLIRTDASGDTLWLRTYGGSQYDYGRGVLQTFPDSGFIIVGTTGSFGPGQADVFLIRTNTAGDTLWMKAHGRAGAHDYGTAIYGTDDGGYLITGHTIQLHTGDNDVLLIRTDAGGDTLWMRTYGSPASHDYAYSVQQVDDGGFVVAGRSVVLDGSADDIFLMKLHEDGQPHWEQRYGGPGQDHCYSFDQTEDGGFVLVGYKLPDGINTADIYLLRTDAAGVLLWEDTHGGPLNDFGYSVKETADGGYIIAGETYSFGKGKGDAYIVKTDSNGDIMWTRGYGGMGDDGARFVRQTSDSGYVLTGTTQHFGAGTGGVLLLRVGSRPVDMEAPNLTIGVFQNPYLTQYLDVFIVGSEALDSASVGLKIKKQPVSVRPIDSAEDVWIGDFTLTAPGGVLSLAVKAADVAGNDTTVTARFSSSFLLAETGGSVLGPDGKVCLTIEGGVLRKDAHIVVIPRLQENGFSTFSSLRKERWNPLAPVGADPASYSIGPVGVLGGNSACLSFCYPQSDPRYNVAPDRLYIVQGGYGPLTSYVDPARYTVKAEISRLGTFSLATGEPGASRFVDPSFLSRGEVFPNPFGEEATLSFEIRARQRVSISVYDVLGRRVVDLYDCTMYPGVHEIVWDGLSSRGEKVFSGTYFIQIRTPHKRAAAKVIMDR